MVGWIESIPHVHSRGDRAQAEPVHPGDPVVPGVDQGDDGADADEEHAEEDPPRNLSGVCVHVLSPCSGATGRVASQHSIIALNYKKHNTL